MSGQFEKVLVTGGAGFIGARVARLLAARGTRTAVLDNLLVGRPLPEPATNIFPLEGDIRDKAFISRVMGQFHPDAIVHLAAVHHIPTCEKEPHLAMDVNVMGTQVLLDAAETHGVKHFLLASSAAVYDWSETALIEDETPLRASDIYSTGKLTNESQLAVWTARCGGRGISARIFNVIGHDDPNGHLIPDILNQLTRDAAEDDAIPVRLGNIAPKRDYTHAEDTARGIVALLDYLPKSAGTEAFNLSRGEEFSVVDLVEKIGSQLGLRLRIESDPTRVRKIDRLHLLGDTKKTSTKLGWRAQMSLDDALQDILSHLGTKTRGEKSEAKDLPLVRP